MITIDEAEKAVDWLRDNARKIGEARATRLYTEQWIKTVKAIIMSEQKDSSVSGAEMIALASPRYAEALTAYRDAIKADETLRFLSAAAEAKIEFWRSSEATRRAEGKAYS